MMNLPNSMPIQLMLMMLQSGTWPNASMPWSAPSPDLSSFFPWLPKPKTPLEQGVEYAQNLWQNQNDQWQNLSQQWQSQSAEWLQNLNPPQNPNQQQNQSAKNSGTRERASTNAESPSANPFADMANAMGMPDFMDPAFTAAMGTEVYNQTTGFWQGMQAYASSDYTRPEKTYDVLWSRGSAQLLDLAPDRKDAPAVLCIPSLINTSTILDLYPEASFVDYLKQNGLRPLILDWGTPADDEHDFTTADYINAYALDALSTLRENHDGPIVLLGYCMGGIFATAMAQLAPLFIDGLILFATPWDFSAPDTPGPLLDPSTQLMFKQWIMSSNPVPPMVTQSLFYLIDPWRIHAKYQNFPNLTGPERTHFLAVEQWVNDGVPLAQQVAGECFVDWPHGNILATHQWKVGRRWIEPQSIKTPTLAVIPKRDLIVPMGCAMPLAEQLPRCDILTPDCGHVSMVVGRRAKVEVWEPVVKWVKGKF